MERYYYRAGRVRRLKPGVDPVAYEAAHPEARRVSKPRRPSIQQLEVWMDRGACPALDGCIVETDGTCPHGCPSRMVYFGLI